MVRTEQHVDLKGRTFALTGLDKDERALVARLKQLAATNPEWSAYRNIWMTEVHNLYAARGLNRREMVDTVAYRVGQDIGSRLGVSQGKMRPPDNRDG